MQRSEVYELIDEERAYQDNTYPAVDGYSASPEGFLLVIEELAAQARTFAVRGNLPPIGDGSVVMDYIRKIGATAVRAMEQYPTPVRVEMFTPIEFDDDIPF